MFVSKIFLIIAAQAAIVMLILVVYLIYTLIKEETRWEEYSNKLKQKIRELFDFKDRFDVVTDNLHKEIGNNKALSSQVEEQKQQLDEKDKRVDEQLEEIKRLKNELANIQSTEMAIDDQSRLLQSNTQTIDELKTQLDLLEDEVEQHPAEIRQLNHSIETLQNENNELRQHLDEVSGARSLQLHQANKLESGLNFELSGKSRQDVFEDLRSQNTEEIDRLRKNYKNQKSTIDDLEALLMEASKNHNKLEIDESVIAGLKQTLNESNTVIEMLEGEIDQLHLELAQLKSENIALTTNNSAVAPGTGSTDSLESALEDALFDDSFETENDSTEPKIDRVFDDFSEGNSKESEFFDDLSADIHEEMFFDDESLNLDDNGQNVGARPKTDKITEKPNNDDELFFDDSSFEDESDRESSKSQSAR